jgi:hypothetical protein
MERELTNADDRQSNENAMQGVSPEVPSVPIVTPSSDSSTVASDTPLPPYVQTNGAVSVPGEPPAYTVAVSLPTYEEYEQAKEREEQEQEESRHLLPEHSQSFTDIPHQSGDRVLGTDSMFAVGFIFSFLFNWFGLLLSLCLMHTVAGRYGALAGFGLSIVKWILIVKSSDWAQGVAGDDSWIYCLMLAFGLLITCSGCLQYICIKYNWYRRRAGIPFTV